MNNYHDVLRFWYNADFVFFSTQTQERQIIGLIIFFDHGLRCPNQLLYQTGILSGCGVFECRFNRYSRIVHYYYTDDTFKRSNSFQSFFHLCSHFSKKNALARRKIVSSHVNNYVNYFLRCSNPNEYF